MVGKSSSINQDAPGWFACTRGFFALLVLGIGTLFFSTTLLFMYPFAPDWSTRTVSRIWSRACMWAGGIRLHVEGLEKLDLQKRYVFVANHQSALDIPIILAAIPLRISFIAKRSLFMIPFFGWGILVAGHIWIDRSRPRKARESILRAAGRLRRNGHSLLVFPEGTRSSDGSVAEFKRGSFALAIEAGADLVPVAISNSFRVLPKRSFICRGGEVGVSIAEPIPGGNLKGTDKPRLAQQAREQILSLLEEGVQTKSPLEQKP